MRNLVIIGNSAAGLAAIEAIRARDRRSGINLIAAEPHPPYSRVMLTYLLAGKVDPAELFLYEPDWYTQMDVNAKVGSRAVGIDARRGQVTIEPGGGHRHRQGSTVERIPYDRLLIATGAAAQRPDLPGIDLPGVFCLRDLDDARAILQYALSKGIFRKPRAGEPMGAPPQPGAPRVLFVGGGPVCLQTLVALATRGMKAHLLVRSPQIFSQLADKDTARLAERVLRKHGVRVIKGAGIVAIEDRALRTGGGRSRTGGGGASRTPRLAVHTSEDDCVLTDMVVIGKGTRPKLALAQEAGVATDVGILVDDFMRTSVTGIWAAGDVAQATHCLTGAKVSFGTWTNARDQGRIAGLNMIGYRVRWPGGLNRNVTTLFGNTLASVGLLRTSNGGVGDNREYHTFLDRRKGLSRRLVFRYGRCEGAVLWNSNADLGVLCSLIGNRHDCSGWEDSLTRGETGFGELVRQALPRVEDGK